MVYLKKTERLTGRDKTRFCILVILLMLLNVAICKAGSNIGKKERSCKTLRSMARIYLAYGEYNKAQTLAERALHLAKGNDVPDRELGSCLIDLAYVYMNQGKFSDAEEMGRLGLQLQEEVCGKGHPYTAYTLRTIASTYRGQGEYEKAELTLDMALKIMLEIHQADDQVMAPFYVDIAKLLVDQHKCAEAETYYLKALHLIKGGYGTEHLYTAEVFGELAGLYALQGRYSEAEPLIKKTLAIQEKIYGAKHHLLAQTWLTMAEICRAKGDHQQLENLIQQATAAVEKTGNAHRIEKLGQRIEKIRTHRQVAYAPAAMGSK